MAKLLYLEASPRKERSHSIAVAKALLDAYQENNPDDELDYLDLWNETLPQFDGPTIDAKYAILHGQDQSEEQQAAWQAVVDTFNRFNAADKYVISLPMWNFGVPYQLKHFIDVITQPTLAFNYDPQTGYTGLVTGKSTAVIYARGGAYSEGDSVSMDFQRPYMELWLGFIGLTDIKSVVVEPTLAGPDDVQAARERAIEEAKQIGAAL